MQKNIVSKISKKINRLQKHYFLNYRDLKIQWIHKIEQPVILISQIERSGGTLLSQLFDGHPQVYAHPWEFMWDVPPKHMGMWPNLLNNDETIDFKKVLEFKEKFWITRYVNLGFYQKNLKELKKNPNAPKYPFIYDIHLQERIYNKLIKEEKITNQRQVLNCYLTSFFNAWIDYQNIYTPNKKIVTGFTPRVVMNTENLERFFKDYPDGYLLTSIRHPASWYSSVFKRGYL
ncbi:MAG: hypothetical protein RH949_30830 [Coleofasciculus sp. A1-SPW-01]|uniref:hypothetical protein n=1 Tax=Coleofasciculus sp. A1-SPW-01 TaxID=3070819 RepID=UPI0032F26630